MRKSYLLAAAVTMLTACTNNENLTNDLSYDGQVLIGFETFHEKSTKAAINAPTDLTFDNLGFGVYGFKHLNDRTASAGIINLSDTDPENNVNYVTSIFDNVMVRYATATPESYPTRGFYYDVPKYWDKEKFYTFFAYAPHTDKKAAAAVDEVEDDPNTTDVDESKAAIPEVKGISFDQTKGLFTRNDILALQSTSKSGTYEGNSNNRTQFKGVSESVTDYLIAPYVPHQKYGVTNQTTTGGYSGTSYTGQEITVGFTFSHILSKLNVFVKAEDQSIGHENPADNGHNYSGVKDIKVTKLNIENLPNATTEIATYAQNATDAVAGTWTPGIYSTVLNIIGGTNATSTDALYILDGGIGTASTVTNGADEYIDQEFHYYIAPNNPDNPATVDNPETADVVENFEHYTLNIDYVITYVDGTKEPFARSINLANENAAFTSMSQNNTYNINITIGLTQIYFTVDAVNAWIPDGGTNTDVEIK